MIDNIYNKSGIDCIIERVPSIALMLLKLLDKRQKYYYHNDRVLKALASHFLSCLATFEWNLYLLVDELAYGCCCGLYLSDHFSIQLYSWQISPQLPVHASGMLLYGCSLFYLSVLAVVIQPIEGILTKRIQKKQMIISQQDTNRLQWMIRYGPFFHVLEHTSLVRLSPFAL